MDSICRELEGKTVLVVDDDADLAETIRDQLETIGMKVVGVARDGKSAMELVKQKDPALVILDIEMPGEMDGIEVAGWINKMEPRAVMFLSAYSDTEYIERAKRTGVFTYLVKPVSIDKMIPSIVLTFDRFSEMMSLKATVDDMKESLSNSSVIDQARNILMKKKGITERDAYSAIRAMSQDENKPMADIAHAIVLLGEML